MNDGASGRVQYRMPAEWEAQQAVWLQWPAERMREYAGYGVKLESTWLEMTRLLHTEVRVRIIVGSDPERDRLLAQFHQFGIDSSRCDLFVMATDDVWARDNGPIFVLDERGTMTVTDWNFNGWGGRFGCAKDRAVPAEVARLLGCARLCAPIVAEGGAIEVDGAGTLIATKSSLVNANRNAGVGHDTVEKAFAELLGIRHVIWLSGAAPEVCESLGDGTDYHVDIAARFTPQGAVLYCDPAERDDPRHSILLVHREELGRAADVRGHPLDLVPLPTPRVYSVADAGCDFAGGKAAPRRNGCSGRLTDAAYTNYLVTNQLVLVPVYGLREDERAKAIIAEHFPGRRVVGVPSVSLTEEGGAIHCVTQQEPRAGNLPPG